MRRIKVGLIVVAAVMAAAVALGQPSVKNYFSQAIAGGDNVLTIGGTQRIASGGTLAAKSGGTVSLESGSIFTSAVALKSTSAFGACAAGKCTAVDYGTGLFHQTVVTFTLTGANDVDVADAADKTTGVLAFTFPEGRILILGATINGQDVTNAAWNANPNDAFYVGVGTADGTQAADADLTATEQDVIPKTTLDTASGATLTLPWTGAMSTLAAANNVLDGTTTAAKLYVNVATPNAANSGATTHAITGTLKVTWVALGDY